MKKEAIPGESWRVINRSYGRARVRLFNLYHHLTGLPETAVNFISYARSKRIIIGAGKQSDVGWLSTDKISLDVTDRRNFSTYWRPGSRLAFMAEHVWEHLEAEERKKANANCFEFLRPQGWLRIAVPDGFCPDPDYIEYVRPGGMGSGAEDHRILFNYKLLRDELEKAGFEVKLLEYWDEKKCFHFQKWSPEDGYIRRSKRYDPRNQGGMLAYTSLIVDAIKP